MNRHTMFVALALLPLLAAAAEPRGRAVYQAVCMACHAPENVMVSAPKAGDGKEWARRIALAPGGIEMLTDHAERGFGAMPPKGGQPGLSREELRDAIEFMRKAATTK